MERKKATRAQIALAWLLAQKPWIVPTFRLGLAGGFWYYPRLSGTREQTRELVMEYVRWLHGLVARGT